MLDFPLRWSRIELAFVSCCHFFALAAVLHSAIWAVLQIPLLAAVLASYGLHLRERLRTFYVGAANECSHSGPKLSIARDFALLGEVGRQRRLPLPTLVYFSEFLVVLCFRPQAGAASLQRSRASHLVLWPDSLRRCDDRRLRRYLRFEQPHDLIDG
jgi:hypothetical protein